MRSFQDKGRYTGDESTLPHRDHPEGAVPFKEPEDMKKLSVFLNVASIGLCLLTFAVFFLRADGIRSFNPFGAILGVAMLVPHEFLHAVCFPGDVYMYQNLRQGMLFVVSPDDLTKGQFIWMSLCPNVVFGFVPFLLFLIWPHLTLLGTLGAIAIPCGVGDYMNAWNGATQMPRGALTYLSGMHSYWYLPKDAQ